MAPKKPTRKKPTPEPGTNASGAPPRAAIERELRVWDRKRPNYKPEAHQQVRPDMKHARQLIETGDAAYNEPTGSPAGGPTTRNREKPND